MQYTIKEAAEEAVEFQDRTGVLLLLLMFHLNVEIILLY